MDKFVPLNENKDFRRIYAKGKSYVSSSVITYVSKNRCKQIRVGITTSKKIGNAVQRNRARSLFAIWQKISKTAMILFLLQEQKLLL